MSIYGFTPKHTPVMTTVASRWTLDSIARTDDINIQYMFQPVRVTPTAEEEKYRRGYGVQASCHGYYCSKTQPQDFHKSGH